jgi:hypothetical protein
MLRKKRIIDDLPTSKTQGVFIGLSELKGTAESESPFISYLAERSCVHFSYKVEEHWQRTVVETYTDGKGNVQTRTRTESGWKQVAEGGQSAPFYLKDETGLIRIVPEGADLHTTKIFDERVREDSPLYYGKGPAGAIANSTHQRRFTEYALPLHAFLYVLGQARERQDIAAAEIARDKASPLFIISTRTEKQISRGYAGWFWMWLVLGFLVAMGAAVGWLWVSGGTVNWQPFFIMGGAYLLAVVLVYLWTTYNNLINLHHRVQQGWSQVDVQLKRRYDLIPNLVAVVQAYKEHEQDTQQTLAALRAQMAATPAGREGPDYRGLNVTLKALVERYPELKANESFLKLHKALVDCEERIALARDYYNQVVTFYNTRLEIIPERYAAGLARLKPDTLMSAADFERAPVSVNLAD